MVTASSGRPGRHGRDAGTEPLVQELRMARLLSSVEMSALSDIRSAPGASVSALGWITVLEERDEALERLADELDTASAPRRDADAAR